MTKDDANADQQTQDEAPRPKKKLYQKPDFRFEKVFETMALSCGKISPTEFQCRFNRKTS